MNKIIRYSKTTKLLTTFLTGATRKSWFFDSGDRDSDNIALVCEGVFREGGMRTGKSDDK